MEHIFIGVILLVQVITVSTAGVIPLHDFCAEGEPVLGDSQPDLNITVQPSLNIPEMSPITITCDADIPRFPANVSDPQLPAVIIMVHVGAFIIEQCTLNPIKQCRAELSSFFPGFPRTITCTAINAKEECRFKTVNVNLTSPLEEATTTREPIINMTTATPNTNVSTSTNTPESNFTTSVPTEDITNAPTTPSTEDSTTAHPNPDTPTGDESGNRRTPVSTTIEILPPITTTPTTSGKKEDDDDDDDDDEYKKTGSGGESDDKSGTDSNHSGSETSDSD